MPATEPIRSERLLLTPLHVDDANDMVSVLAHPDLYSFTGGEPPTFDQLQQRYRNQSAGSPRDDETWHNWIVRLDGSAIGFVQATVVGELADLAWVVGHSWQGRGYGSEAARALRDWLAAQGVGRFTAHIHPDHAASMAVAERLGLEGTGRLDEDGEMIWASGHDAGGHEASP